MDGVPGYMKIVFPRGTMLPVSAEGTGTCSSRKIEITIYEGDRIFTKHNRYLGTLTLTGSTDKWTAVMKFDVNAESLLTVTIGEKGNQRNNSVTERFNLPLGRRRVRDVVRDAEENAASDMEEFSQLAKR